MPVFRCCYILLGLTLCVFEAWCNSICGTKFTDAASSAHLADIVLEGDVTVIRDSARGNYNVSIKVQLVSRRKIFKVYKDTSGSVKRVLEKSRGVIKVGEFGRENAEACITEISKDSSYVFFLRATESPEYFRISAFPISTSVNKKANKKLRKLLYSVVCDGCAKPPRINKRLKSITVKEGSKITLKCSASGYPRPKITWLKDGKVLSKAKGMRIKKGKRGSRLQYRRASRRAEGEYKCVAENVLKHVERTVDIEVTSKSDTTTTVPVEQTSPRFTLCRKAHRGLCLNGGKCFYSKDLGERFCRCPITHGGDRCQHQQAIYPYTEEPPREAKAKLERDRTLIVIGIVIACLVFIVICILSYYLAKQKRTSFYKRREERRRDVNESYKPLLRDEVDSAANSSNPKKMSMTTQTDESVFILMESGQPVNDQPIQPVVANHVFAHFPNSSPVHLREKPVNQSTNAHPPRYRLNAVSLEADDPPSAVDGRDSPDTAHGSDLPTGKDTSVNSPDSVSCNSSSSLPKESTFSGEVSAENSRVANDGGLNGVALPLANAAMLGDEEDSSDEEEDLTAKHPELQVDLHISEEDLSESIPVEGATRQNSGAHKEAMVEENSQTRPAGVSCNGVEADKGLYDEDEDSSSEDSSNSNSSSSSTSLADPEGVPAILSLENHHAKGSDGNLSWDEHGTPVISQYACNPYALDMDDDFVNSQLYEPADFRLFSENLESPPPPPIGDKLRDVRDDQDPVSL